MASLYEARATEQKWQKIWDEKRVHDTNLDDRTRKPYYNLVMFPYPSGNKLHIGHWYNFGPADSWGRYMRMQGYNVFEPMGFDAFGLPAENYAIKTGIHPDESTSKNVETMVDQLKAIGAMYDWSQMVNTSKPDYYKWTQWLFLQMYKQGLAYKKKAPVNWCPSCMTVLANEQVQDGACERCKTEVIKKELEQWFWKITDYVEQLLDYEGIDWPEKTITMQKNWIGKSIGCDVAFPVKGMDLTLKTFTTTVDTVHGVTFVVISPEHPDVSRLVTEEQRAQVDDYIQMAQKKSEIERTAADKAKDGVFTGSYVINPLNGQEVPLWVADYVLMNYGTGVVMGVPAHDQRDMDFAKAYELPIVQSVELENGETFVYDDVDKYNIKGRLIDSGEFTGLSILEGRKKIINTLEKNGWGESRIQYRLRDWLISRQRYWGAPIPMVNCDACGEVPVPEDQLPVVLPEVEDYKPQGKSPLANNEAFMATVCPNCDGPATREADTMDTFVCSSWYFLRYPCANDTDRPFDPEQLKHWGPVDMYIGGPEHACMHLLYARFVNQVLHDAGFVPFKEPFKRLVHQGMVTKDGAKMSKSKGNVVSPDSFVEDYGSDVFRMYMMFMGPFTQGGDWSDKGITGVSRFIQRVWKVLQTPSVDSLESEIERSLHATIKKVTGDIEKLHFNTALAALMEFVNGALKLGLDQASKLVLVRLIAPLAPHFAEEAWIQLNGTSAEAEDWESVFNQEWPSYDEALTVQDTINLVVQVNGKVRATLETSVDIPKEEAFELARAQDNVARYLEGKTIVKEIFVPGKLVSFVVQ